MTNGLHENSALLFE